MSKFQTTIVSSVLTKRLFSIKLRKTEKECVEQNMDYDVDLHVG